MANIAPIFDRLLDENIEILFEKNPKKFASLEEFHASIVEDLSRLLNTRLPIVWREFTEKNYATPYSYGINVTEAIFSESASDTQKIERRIEKIIEQFEPRLSNVKASVVGSGSDQSSLFVNIDAIALFGDRKTPLSFPIAMQS